jgi:hypothetical protein
MAQHVHPAAPGGQGTDPSDVPERRTRSSALRLTDAEASAVRIAVRKVAKAHPGGYVGLAVAIGIPASTLYYAARPGCRPSPGFAIRLAAVAKVPVEVLLGGKVVVAHVIGVEPVRRAA